MGRIQYGFYPFNFLAPIFALGSLEFSIGPLFFYFTSALVPFFLVLTFLPFGRGSGISLSLSPDSLLRVSLFFILFSRNLSGLRGAWSPLSVFPVIVILLSFSVWGGVILRWFSSSLTRFFSHITPQDLPLAGAVPIATIELLRALVRPLTLGIRLCANIRGGHLITELLEEIGAGRKTLFCVGGYETFVRFIQALIFSLLLLSYQEEISESN